MRQTLIASSNVLERDHTENFGLTTTPPNTDADELSDRSDEELCRNARHGCVASRELLWRRYRDFIQTVLHRENKHQYLRVNRKSIELSR